MFAVSTLRCSRSAIVLHFFPNALGRNVAEAAPLVVLAIVVPGLRNLVEYQAELLFARGQMLLRALNLGAACRGQGGAADLGARHRRRDTPNLVLSLNVVFCCVYLASTLLTYSALRLPSKTI